MAKYRRLTLRFSLIILVLVVGSLAGFTWPAKSAQFSRLWPPSSEPALPATQEISSTETTLDVSITEEGMFPPVLWGAPGITIRWTNQTSQTQRLEGTKTAFVPDAGSDAGPGPGGPQTLYLPLIFKGDNDSPGSQQTPDSPPSLDSTWQSGDLQPGESFERTFEEFGAYPYHLAGSPTLSGTIILPEAQLVSSLSVLAVTTTTDDNIVNGNCTLREAIIAANKNIAVDACPKGYGADSIVLGAGVYALTLTGSGEDAAFKGDLDITKYSDVTIVGTVEGTRTTIIDAGQLSDRVFHILSGGKLKLSNVTIQGGRGYGGGLYNVGTLTLINSSVISNTASGSFGGGLKNEGTATISGSTFSGNSADYGGGIYNRGLLTLTNSTVSGNTAKTYGGGLKNEGTLKLNNVTISANTANNKGGGVLNYYYGKTYFKNTIIAGNTAPDPDLADCDYLSTGIQSFYSYGYNLSGAGCPSTAAGDKPTTNPGLGLLQNNDGSTFTHALLPGSPAIDAGNPATPGSGGNACEVTDQRGEPRPVDGDGNGTSLCDIGAYEAKPADSAQTSPYIINVSSNTDDGVCTQANCSLREAVNAANAHPNGSTPDEIRFNIPISGVQTIQLTSTLVISDPVIIDGTTQPGASCNSRNLLIQLDGTNAVSNADGLYISGGGSTVRGLIITRFSQNGLRLDTNGGNVLECNAIGTDAGGASGLGNAAAGVFVSNASNNTIGGTAAISGNLIAGNGGAGIVISGATTAGNAIRSNTIFSNTLLGIDLGGDGVTQNDLNDADGGPNNGQNFPVLSRAIPTGSDTIIEGRLNSSANTTFNLEFFADETCDPATFGEGQTFMGAISATTNISGNISFATSFPTAIPEGQFVAATATDPNGNTSEFSQCAQVNLDNDAWPRALNLDGKLSAGQYLDKLGQSRWYKFTVTPNSRVIVTLTDLPANYDLTVYKDISATFRSDLATLGQPDALLRLGAEFAAGARSPDEFAAGARSPDAFAAGARSPDAFAVANFSPDVFAAGARSPDAFAAGARSPDAFAAGARSPDVFAPDAFAPDAFAAGARSPDDIAAGARSPEFLQAFASAQTRSLIGFSAFEGTASEGIILNTWNNSGDFYVRVRGRDGAFSQSQKFRLEVTLLPGTCNNVGPLTEPLTTPIEVGRKTIILTDLARMEGTPEQKKELWQALNGFAGRSEIAGKVINVGPYQFNDPNFPDQPGDARVIEANKQANKPENLQCPYAKNLVAQAIKEIIDAYRNASPQTLQYIVLVGNDNVIPFFRYPDSADLGPESDYVPPVFDLTASQASLKLNYVLSQDAYGSKIGLSFNVNQFPVPNLPVGRLVETPADIMQVLNAYAQTNGVVTPSSALVTGYDFFADAAAEIKTQLEAGLAAGIQADTLIALRNASPLDPSAWTADQLKAQLLNRRHDLVFLGGHFSAASALAADYQTRLVSADLAASSVLTNAIIFSIGCHSGYNIVNEHGIPFVTREPDWAQAFAQKGATLIAGTGYQYGDTDFIEYSERIYLEFARQLRTGTGPVAVGDALVKAKQKYLAETPEIRGLHEKSLLISTIFGLPMLKVDMPRKQAATGGFPAINGSIQNVMAGPGAHLGLATSNISINTPISDSTVSLKDVDNPSAAVPVTVLASQSLDGVYRSLTNAGEPVLPLWLGSVPGSGSPVLRGVGFRGGSYSDDSGVRPLTGAPTTEIRGVHTSFFSNVFFPIQPWRVNYFDALADGSGPTTLALMPAQFKTDDPALGTNLMRRFSNMQFRLYYSNNTSSSALAAAPAIVGISATPTGSSVIFKVNVVGDPTAGVQEVWVTYTTLGGTQWQPLDLSQDTNDSTLWTGTLTLNGTPAQGVRYIVQAANGVGLVSLATNVGAYYIPGVTPGAGDPTALSLDIPGSGVYGSQPSFRAVLSSNGAPLAGQLVTIGLGSQSRQAVTGPDGSVTVKLPLLALPGQNTVRAVFGGTVDKAPSSDTKTFTIAKQNTLLTLSQPASGPASKNILLEAILTDASVPPQRLFEKSIFFEVIGTGGVYRASIITDFAGRASLGNLPLPPGTYTVNAYFNGTIPVGGANIFLDDARYNPAVMATGTLILTAPTAQDDAYSVDEDTTLNVAAPGVLGNDTNAEFPSLTALLVSGPANGSLTLNADGSFSYTPNANFNGSDSFTYKANDGALDSNVATVTLTVNPVNDAPAAVNDSYSVDEDTTLNVAAPGVLANDTDIDSASLAALLVSGPANGSLTLNADGSFSYTPNANFNGSDSFTYKANDGSLNSNVATVTITVRPVNDAPQAANDSYTATQNKTLTVPAPGVLTNDTDVDGDALRAVLVTGPGKGTLTLNANGSFTYTPNANYSGSDSFTYKANDGMADSNVATVTIIVKPSICSTATANPITIWPPNKDLWVPESINVSGAAAITITAIFQDESVGNGKYSPDGFILGSNKAKVRAERDGSGDGRVYHIFFTAVDGQGGFCSGQVLAAIVPHDQSNIPAVDGGPLCDSTQKGCVPPPAAP